MVAPDHLFWVLNAYWEDLSFTLPGPGRGHVWAVLVNTSDAYINDRGNKITVKGPFTIPARSSVLLKVV